MNVLITGGNGFVGRHLVQSLSKDGHNIIAPVRGGIPFVINNVHWLTESSFSEVDWLKSYLSDTDVVIHAAAHAHQTYDTTIRDAQIFQEINVKWPERLYVEAQKAGVGQFIFISSIGAQASTSDQLISERSVPRPSNNYSRSKLAAEISLRRLAKKLGSALTIIRPCLVYGPGNPGNMERLSRLIDTGLPLPFGKVAAVRSFVFVDNLVSAISVCLLDERTYGEDFIVCDDQAVNLPELITAIANAKDKTGFLVNVPVGILRMMGKVGDALQSITKRSVSIDSYSIDRLTSSLVCDNSKIKNLLCWQPPVTFSAGIKRTFDDEQ